MSSPNKHQGQVSSIKKENLQFQEPQTPEISGWEITMNSYSTEDYHHAHTGTQPCAPHYDDQKKNLKADEGECISGWETTVNSFQK